MNARDIEPMVVSVEEAARLLSVSKPTVYQYAHRADFPSFKLRNRTVVSVEGLREWVKQQAAGEGTED